MENLEYVISEIEKHFDKTWDEIRITKLSLYIALFDILHTSERLFESGLKSQQMIHIRQSVGMLIPHIYNRCAKGSDLTNLKMGLGQIDEESEIITTEAITFAELYGRFSYHITDYHKKQTKCEVKGRSITFCDYSSKRLIRSLMHHDLRIYHEAHSLKVNEISNIKSKSVFDELGAYCSIALKKIKADRIFKTIPKRVYAVYKDIVMSGSFEPTVDIGAIFDEYSVEEYYRFWTSISALMCSYKFICAVKFNDKTEIRDTTVLAVFLCKVYVTRLA
jgi:hypothetical protein